MLLILIFVKCEPGILSVFPVMMHLGMALKCFVLWRTVQADRNGAGEERAHRSERGPGCPSRDGELRGRKRPLG